MTQNQQKGLFFWQEGGSPVTYLCVVLDSNKTLWWSSAVAALGGQIRQGVTAQKPVFSCVRARAGTSKGQDCTGYLGISFPSQTRRARVTASQGAASEGLCQSPRARGEAHGCPRRTELSVGGRRVIRGARSAGTGLLGRPRARLAPRSRHSRRQASASGGKYGFVPGRLPARRVRCPPRPATPRVPPAPHEEPGPAWHPRHRRAARGETEARAKGAAWECAVGAVPQWGSRGQGPEPGRARVEGPGPVWCSAAALPSPRPAAGPTFVSNLPERSGGASRCRLAARRRTEALQLPRGLAQARPCAAEPRPVRAGAGDAAGRGRAGGEPAGPLTGVVLGIRARRGEPAA